ncbi:MAG: mannose-1-phosphate guanylyltransferase/mannose-6-phosphate isomerase [Pseudomonadota bacterium]
MTPIVPILLAGGTGTRLWPVSRADLPKQFLPLHKDRSTFEATLMRVSDREVFGKPIIITNDAYRFHVEVQAKGVGMNVDILLEPCARDSAPAIAAAGAFARSRDGDDVTLLILSADHVVLDDDLFVEAVVKASAASDDGRLVVFGIKPNAPKSEFGYIVPGEPGADLTTVRSFVEKPDAPAAAELISNGALWNAGYFMMRGDVLASELLLNAPDIAQATDQAVANSKEDLSFHRLDPEAFSASPKISFDYAVMEKTTKATVVAASFRWSDTGSWEALWEISSKDKDGNAFQGPVNAVDAKNCLVLSEDAVTGLVGVDDLIVTVTSDAVLVAHRSRAQDVKGLVEQLKTDSVPQAIEHRLVRRPWGSYDAVDEGERFKVKRLTVHPGAALSLQRHVHRAEHWVVVRGVAEVTIGDEVQRLGENQSTYIPQGAVHRLANPGHIPLELIEVQSGAYLGEDDIERLEDVFGRV